MPATGEMEDKQLAHTYVFLMPEGLAELAPRRAGTSMLFVRAVCPASREMVPTSSGESLLSAIIPARE